MKKIPLLFITILSFQFSFSQGGIWTWISGSSAISDPGVYGTQGVPSLNNYPPAAYEYVDWKDKQGNFWLYGGTYPNKSDLWKFNPLTLEWTWVKGNSMIGQAPVYGTQGVPDPANTPGERSYAANTWVDTSGNFWLFGGYMSMSVGLKGDLWKYDPGTNEWTWMSGSQQINSTGVHGIQGVPSVSNRPGARGETSSAWTDLQNNLWLFGGSGIDDVSNLGRLNDLMKYNIATNEWTWMKGSALADALPFWGTKNIANPANDPGARYSHSHWIDSTGGLWLMGGYKIGFLNDVWRYNTNTNNWIWEAGANFTNHTGIYSGTCYFDSLNLPRSRTEHRSSVQDPCGRFWMYGGNYSLQSSMLNDLWVFDSSTLEWSLLSGSNQINPPFNYGTKGIPSPANSPPASTGGVAWWGNDNRFYMMGGLETTITTNTFGALWVFTPDSLCDANCIATPVALFVIPGPICQGTCISITNNSINATSYQWYFPGASSDSSSAFTPLNICYTNPGTYDVQLIASNATGSDTLSLINYISVYPQPPPQGILQFGDTLFANAGAVFYQWYFNGNIIPGATHYYYIATASGDFNVVATDINGCEVEAVINDVIANTTPLSFGEGSGVRLYPNPVTESLSIISNPPAADKISIYNILGEKILLDVDLETLTVNCRPLNPGIYYLELVTKEKSFRSKFVKANK